MGRVPIAFLCAHIFIERETAGYEAVATRYSPHVRKSKTVLDSAFLAVDSGFQLLDSSLFLWNMDSGFQSLVGLRIPCVVFRIPKPGIQDSTSKRFPDSGIRIPLYGVTLWSGYTTVCMHWNVVMLGIQCVLIHELLRLFCDWNFLAHAAVSLPGHQFIECSWCSMLIQRWGIFHAVCTFARENDLFSLDIFLFVQAPFNKLFFVGSSLCSNKMQFGVIRALHIRSS